MPRRCQINECDGGGKNVEAWRIKEFDNVVVVWLCDRHHQASIDYTAAMASMVRPDSPHAQRDGEVVE